MRVSNGYDALMLVVQTLHTSAIGFSFCSPFAVILSCTHESWQHHHQK